MRFCCRRFAMALGNGLDIVCDHSRTGDPVPRVYLMYGDVSVPVRYCPWCGASVDVEVDETPCECTDVTVAPADDAWLEVGTQSAPDPLTEFEDALKEHYRIRDGQ